MPTPIRRSGRRQSCEQRDPRLARALTDLAGRNGRRLTTLRCLRDLGVQSVALLFADVKLFDENAPGEMVVTAVPVTREVWPRALDAHCLAILPRAPEALLAPIAQVLPRVRASKRHASSCGRISTRVEP